MLLIVPSETIFPHPPAILVHRYAYSVQEYENLFAMNNADSDLGHSRMNRPSIALFMIDLRVTP